jgi:gliding motility associated protien GldN
MKKCSIFFLLAVCFALTANICDAQAKKRTVKKRTTAQRTTNSRTKANVQPSAKVDTTSTVAVTAIKIDSLPIEQIKKSLRPNDAIDLNLFKDQTPLAYENIREDDAVYRQKIWREIDIREKLNLPFRYSATDDNGNQRFISILLKAIQDGQDSGGVAAFSAIDDRFTTPMTIADVADKLSGGAVSVAQYNAVGEISGYKNVVAEVNLDSFYKFRIKEEVIFDKESSRLFWRILGIAPVKNVITSTGLNMGETELFWIYYPDMRPIFAKYEVFNPKNFGAKMTWEELFESRMFYGRIIKSTMDNPYDLRISEFQGIKDNKILQLLEGEDIKDKIFNYEQNLWSY